MLTQNWLLYVFRSFSRRPVRVNLLSKLKNDRPMQRRPPPLDRLAIRILINLFVLHGQHFLPFSDSHALIARLRPSECLQDIYLWVDSSGYVVLRKGHLTDGILISCMFGLD